MVLFLLNACGCFWDYVTKSLEWLEVFSFASVILGSMGFERTGSVAYKQEETKTKPKTQAAK